jgi:hypothetical protein
MKLSTDHENLLKHVVDGFNRNYFRNELKTNIKRNQDFEWSLNHVNNLLEKGEVTYPEHSPEGILILDNSHYPYQDLLRQKKHYEYQVNVGDPSCNGYHLLLEDGVRRAVSVSTGCNTFSDFGH